MRPIVQPVPTRHTPESLGRLLRHEPGRLVLRTARSGVHSARYSIVTARPLLTFRSHGSRCETMDATGAVDRMEIVVENPDFDFTELKLKKR